MQEIRHIKADKRESVEGKMHEFDTLSQTCNNLETQAELRSMLRTSIRLIQHVSKLLGRRCCSECGRSY
jgi:hypothetical protein